MFDIFCQFGSYQHNIPLDYVLYGVLALFLPCISLLQRRGTAYISSWYYNNLLVTPWEELNTFHCPSFNIVRIRKLFVDFVWSCLKTTRTRWHTLVWSTCIFQILCYFVNFIIIHVHLLRIKMYCRGSHTVYGHKLFFLEFCLIYTTSKGILNMSSGSQQNLYFMLV
jgi:hypothetical protein